MSDTILRSKVLKTGKIVECEIVAEGRRWKATVPGLTDFLGILGDSPDEACERCMCAALALLGWDGDGSVDFSAERVWPR